MSHGSAYVGSEIMPILTVAGLEGRVDVEALRHFVRLGFTPGPRTMFAGVEKVPAGCWVKANADGWRMQCYWGLTYEAGRVGADGEVVEEFRDRLGADELLGGYVWHWTPDRGRWWAGSKGLLRMASSGEHPWVERGVEAWRRRTSG